MTMKLYFSIDAVEIALNKDWWLNNGCVWYYIQYILNVLYAACNMVLQILVGFSAYTLFIKFVTDKKGIFALIYILQLNICVL